jgi:signal transduction histidine kinase
LRFAAEKNVHGISTVCVGTSLDFLRHDMARIDRLVLIAAAAILLIAPFCGYWLAGRATKTVADITATAARLRPAHLDERLTIDGNGDEFDELAHTINGLLDRIAAYIDQKRDFLANAAHELRTPLAAIRSSVEVTLAGDRSPETYRELLEDIIEEGTLLETLVNQLLLLSESEADREPGDGEAVPLHEVVSKSVDMFRGVAEVREVTLIADIRQTVTVAGKRIHLRQVVNNLLDNAIKYTPHGGVVTVQLCSFDHGRTAKLSVADTGPGIDPGDVPSIFDRFFRADRARGRDEAHGAGLGLSICKSVIEAHGGTIRCESDLGEGTTMIVEYPAISESSAECGRALASASA